MKKITMKTLSLAFASSLAILTACGDDITNNEVLKAESYNSKEDLPDCGEKYEGKFATIPSKGEVYVCAEGKWKSLLSKAAISEDGDFACSTVELSSGKGYKVVCGGDSVAVVKNGAKGDTGSKGRDGDKGNDGKNGTSGSAGADGEDLTLDEKACQILNAGFDYAVYDCGDSVYVKNMSGLKADVKTWNAFNEETILKIKSTDTKLATITEDLYASTGVTGSLVRWEGDNTWTNGAAVTTAELTRNFAIAGTATLNVPSNAGETNIHTEPFIGVTLEFGSINTDISSWGGVCLTYTSEQPVDVLIFNEYYVRHTRASLGASTEETTVNVLFSEFTPAGNGIKNDDIVTDANGIVIMVLGSLTEGEHTNEFAISEFGAYGECNGPTTGRIKAWAEDVAKPAEPLVDDRTSPAITYNTVTIGNQTWMAENLRLPFDYKTVGSDGVAETSDDEPMALCPADDATDEEKVKGCLYSWAAVMDSLGLYNDASVYQDEDGNDVALKHCGYGKTCALTAPVKGICPDGWHVPSKNEVLTLFETADYSSEYPDIAQRALLADDANWLGFSATSPGYTTDFSSYDGGDYLVMWLVEQYSTSTGSNMYIGYTPSDGRGIEGGTYDLNNGLSVRCIKDPVKE